MSFVNGSAVTSAGVYAIRATEEGYVYSPMAVYVGFGKEDTTEINAKKAPNKVDKTAEDKEKVTEISKTVTYTAKSTIPYIAETDTNKTYVFEDTLSGATYNVVNGKLPVSVKVGTGEPEVYKRQTDDILVVEDAAEFDRLYKEAQEEKDINAKLQILLEACHCYTGEFLSCLLYTSRCV